METITAELSKPISSCSSNFNFPAATSTSRTVTINGSHEFKINGYSLTKGIGSGNSLSSDAFIAGGYQWAIHFYPDGRAVEDHARYVSLFIALESEDSDVRALFEISLIDQSGKGRNKVHTQFGRIGTNLESGPYTMKCRGSRWGFKRFFRRDLLEKSDYLKDDTLVIRCRIGVVVTYTEGVPLPDPDIGHNFGESLKSGSRNDSDVNFQVDGEEFAAQKLKFQHTQSGDSWSSSSVGNWKRLKRINFEEEETTEEGDDAATRIFIFEPPEPLLVLC